MTAASAPLTTDAIAAAAVASGYAMFSTVAPKVAEYVHRHADGLFDLRVQIVEEDILRDADPQALRPCLQRSEHVRRSNAEACSSSRASSP